MLDLRVLILTTYDRMQRSGVELIRVIVNFMESPHPILNTTLLQSILSVQTLDDLHLLMTADVAPVADHYTDIAALSVAISQSNLENASLRRRVKAPISDSVKLRRRLSTT